MRIVSLYYQHELNMNKSRYTVLQELVREEKIFAGLTAICLIMNKWFRSSSVCDSPKSNGSTKISEYDLIRTSEITFLFIQLYR